MTNSRKAGVLIIAASLGFSSIGCEEKQAVDSYDAPKPVGMTTPAAPAPAALPAGTDAPIGPAASGEPKPGKAGDLKFLIPASWTQDLSARQMRLATLNVTGKDGKTAEVVMSQFGAAAGDLLANVNRWRGQVGLPPVQELDESKIQEIQVAGEKGRLFDFAGPDPEKPTKRLLQVDAPHDGGVLYIKILGDAQLVAEQKANFESFVKSVQHE